ncbi:MAG: tetratricopeptide repeat-containing sensor histidine kinase [Ignavibacteriaceae bacterium]
MKESKKILLLVIAVLLFCIISIKPQTQLDSLKNALSKSEGKQKVKLLIKIGYFLSSENPKEAITYLDDAITLAEQTNNKWNKADALFNKGVALWHLGEIKQSDEYYAQAIPIYEQFNDSSSLIKVFNSQAINHQMKGNVDLAFETFLHSLDYAKKIGDNGTILNTLLNIGIMYDNVGNFDKCLSYYLEALKYADGNDKASLALLQSYIAEVYLSIKDFTKAEEFLNKAIENSKLSNDTNSLIWAYSSLGEIQLDKKNYKAAENYFKQSLELSQKSEFKLEVIHSLTDLGKFYSTTNNLALAEKYLGKAAILANEIKSLNDLVVIYGELSLLNSKTQNYKKAFEYHKQYKEFSDSLFAISNTQQIAELDAKYELKQNERQTDLLKNENELQKKVINSQKIIALVIAVLSIASIIFIWLLLRNRNKILKANNLLLQKNDEIENQRNEISQKNEVLAGLNATKDKFFSIIAHDLRNPIAAFVNISDLLEQDYDKLSESDKKEIIGQMNLSSKNLIMLLENLLTWARLSNDKIDVFTEKIIISDIVEASVYPYLQAAQNKKIKITTDVPKNILIATDRFIFQAILGNLINNAIKFSNQHSDINVMLNVNQNSYDLIVKDHGIGIEESQLRNIFVLGKVSTGRGTMGESGTGLGLVLVKELVEKINWHIDVKSKVNAGTEFIVSIPKANDILS